MEIYIANEDLITVMQKSLVNLTALREILNLN